LSNIQPQLRGLINCITWGQALWARRS